MSLVLNPPPNPKDPRFPQWLSLLWEYVTGNASDSAEMIEAGQIFGRKQAPGFPTSIYTAEAQSIEAGQVFGKKQPSGFPSTIYSAESQSILATQVFGG